MNCACPNCKGNGSIICPDCDGSGDMETGIESAKLHKDMPHFDELSELQRDAQRVIKEAKTLAELNPARAESYQEQLLGCLKVINKQADKVVSKPTKQAA